MCDDNRPPLETSSEKPSTLVMETPSPSSRPPKLLDRVRARLRVLHDSIRTEEAYVGWIRRYILFHGKRHPAEMGAAEVKAFLAALAVEKLSSSRVVPNLQARFYACVDDTARMIRLRDRLMKSHSDSKDPNASGNQLEALRIAPEPVAGQRGRQSPPATWKRLSAW